MKSFFQRSRTKWTELEAFEDILAENKNVSATNLTANHTAKYFRWEVGKTAVKSTSGVFSILKSEDLSENQAAHQAMEAFQTFQANLAPEHTETHFVFKKIKG